MPAAPELLWPQLAGDVRVARLPAAEGPLDHVLRRPEPPEACVRMLDSLAEMTLEFDGSRPVDAIVADVCDRAGPDGPALLVRLLAELGERGFLHGIPAEDSTGVVQLGRLARLARPRTWRWRGAPGAIERLYRAGGWAVTTPPALALFVTIALIGLGATVLLLVRGGATPLVVGGRLGLGAACFFAGRMAMVAAHELAHGLALARLGHRVPSAGLKLLAIFPYAFVDTAPAWLEPRRRRMAVTAAGPLSDLVFGGAAAIAVLLTRGVVSQVCFQLCLAGYLTALLNLNPCLERDGYHLLCDALRRHGLRRAAMQDLHARLAGRTRGGSERLLRWYGLAVVAWGVLGAGLAVGSLSGSLPALRAGLPSDVSPALLGTLWVALLAPTALLVGRPLALRAASGWARTRSAPPDAPSAGTGAGPHPHPRPLSSGPAAALSEPAAGGARFVPLARAVLTDASLRKRVRALGPPPGVEGLGHRELNSTVAGVIFAAGGESLALTHLAGVIGPPVGNAVERAWADTDLGQLPGLVGLDHASSHPALHYEPDFGRQAPVPVQTPLLYEPNVPKSAAGRPAAAAAFSAGLGGSLGGPTPPWPGNDAGPVAIAQWMAAGARAAGLPGPLPVMAALVESGLNNNACCDLDSLGYFQMRESIWNFGPYVGYYEHPELQLEWFIHQALIVRDEQSAAGDATFADVPSNWGNWVADIEQPAVEYRGRYAEQLSNAEALLATG